jgi:hypothetical protein
MSSSLRSTAIHEAGHVVVGRVLGLVCGGATIVPDHKEDEAGHAVIGDPLESLSAWDEEDREKSLKGETPLNRDEAFAYRASAIARMAGAEAELECIGSGDLGDGDDRYWIGIALEHLHIPPRTGDPKADWHHYERGLRVEARELVRRHKDKIERVAQELLERKSLTKEEIDALITS